MTHPIAEMIDLWAPEGEEETAGIKECAEEGCKRETVFGKDYCWRHVLIECPSCGVKMKRGRIHCAPCEADIRLERVQAAKELEEDWRDEDEAGYD